jgi:FAD/FMN-containing dehydrogenase
MTRRIFAAGVVLTAFAGAGCKTNRPAVDQEAASTCRCTPDKRCWPSQAEWQAFGTSLHGKLEQPESPLAPCRSDAAGAACASAIKNSKNPLYLQDQVGGTQSNGWLGAWTAAPSAYAVVAEDAADIVAAVNFARQRGLRLVIKGTGHDYLGRSNAPDSLLVWTHKMRRVSIHDAFVPRGCPATARSPAVTVEAGTRWIEAYQEVTVKHGRYVQGGGCTTVGAAGGFIQGGGFGSWSKKYGIAAANMLEAEVVTADGSLLVANDCQNQDLFWALRGGGGGTFGIATKVTLRTHPLPSYFGVVDGSIVAKNDAAFKELLERFLLFYRERLSNEHWGEQVRARRDNSLKLSLVFEGMTAKEAEQVWQPLRDWIERRADTLTMKVNYLELPGVRMWDYDFLKQNIPDFIEGDPRPDQPAGRFWWAGDGEQVSTYWYGYQSRWVPLELFEGANAKRFTDSLFEASRQWSVELHFHKGQAGAAAEAVQRGRETSMNPAVFKAAALIIIAANTAGYPGVPGHEPDQAKGETAKARMAAAMKVIRDATPGAGSYVNETDYFEPNWQQEFWGENYQRLSQIKRKYDPDGLFFCHHCVGSEQWTKDGLCRSGLRP